MLGKERGGQTSQRSSGEQMGVPVASCRRRAGKGGGGWEVIVP